MTIRPITLRAARAFIGQHHRHNLPPRGWRYGAALYDGDELVGVATAGQPVARVLDDGLTLEVTRVCTVGTKNASTMLYGAIGRAAKALGYHRLITYTLKTEPGTSLEAAGFRRVGEGKGGRTWASKGRGRQDRTLWGESIVPAEGKVRWERVLHRDTLPVASDRVALG